MKKMKYPQVGIVAIIGITMLCLIVVPLVAEYNFEGFPVETQISGFVNGGVFIDYEPWAGTTTLTGEFDVPDGEVKWARLYAGIWGGNPRNNGWIEVTFNGVDNESGLGQIHLQGESDTNPNVWCSGNGKHWMYYNVTDLVAPGSTNTATTSKINSTAGICITASVNTPWRLSITALLCMGDTFLSAQPSWCFPIICGLRYD